MLLRSQGPHGRQAPVAIAWRARWRNGMKKVLLRCFHNHSQFALLDEETMQVELVPISSSMRADSRHTNGVFGQLGAKSIIVYRARGLWLRLDDLQIPFDDSVSITLQRADDESCITVRVATREIASWRYTTPEVGRSADWDFSFVEEEDRDLGLFLKTLADRRDRRHRCFRASISEV